MSYIERIKVDGIRREGQMHRKQEKAKGKKQPGEEELQLFAKGLMNLRLKGWILVIASTYGALKIIEMRHILAEKMNIGPLAFYALLIIPIVIIIAYASKGPKSEEEKFRSISLTNANGETPELLRKNKSKNNPIIEERVYHSEGIPIEKWLQKRNEIESALDCSVVFVERNGETKKEILLGVIDSKYAIPTKIEWDDKFIPGLNLGTTNDDLPKGKISRYIKKHEKSAVVNGEGGFKVTLGECITGPLLIDLDAEPHVIIGGTTGSGKSVLLRQVLWQCIRKGAKVCIIDFKGGVEFGGKWEEFSKIYTERGEAIEMLTQLQLEMEARFRLFKRFGCKNLMDYNEMHPDSPLCRIVLACDEVGSMMNKQGADKETKADLAIISKVLMELAMKSRAAGINMLLATQRPDAETLPGQLRSNLPVRICGQVGGKAGLSEIVLDDPIAATISARQRGRFYTNVEGMTEFQGYLFLDSKHMKKGNYQLGETLLEDNLVPTPRTYEAVDEEQRQLEEEMKAELEIKDNIESSSEPESIENQFKQANWKF